MTTKQFKIEVNASSSKVWFALFDDAHYRQWTTAFCEGSYYKADALAKGNKIHFLSPSGEGMFSTISNCVEKEKLFFTHNGELKNFEEQPLTDESKAWTGAKENYTLTENNGTTTLVVDVDIDEKHLEYFEKTFPLALQKVKEIAEHFFITVKTTVNAPIETVWEKWTNANDVMQWNNASPDWHTPKAVNNFNVGKKFNYTMAAKDGSFSFDFEGTYTTIIPNTLIEYNIIDGRKVKIHFESNGQQTILVEEFEPENQNSYELQRGGWQAIITNFKTYVESN